MFVVRSQVVEYQDFRLDVKDVCFGRGITLLIGPNGAGKTTMLESLVGIRKQAQTEVLWRGEPWTFPLQVAIKEQLAFMPDSPFLYKRKTIEFHRKLWDTFYPGFNSQTFQEYLVFFKLISKKKALQLSAGQRRLFYLSLCLAYSPQLIILDEPFAFLDPLQSERVFSLLEDYCTQNKEVVVIISSHLIHWLQKFSLSTIVLDNGSVVAQGHLTKSYDSYFQTP